MTRPIAILAALAICACGEPYAAQRRTLDAAGFTDVRIEGHSWFGCAKEETGYRFTATNAREREVSGVVCCGLFAKLCTVRF